MHISRSGDVMTQRTASCACGSVGLIVRGEPMTISMCHCTQCQRRTGSTYSVHGYFLKDQVEISGTTRSFRRSSDSGRKVDFHFCTNCGSTAYWYLEPFPDRIGVPVGLFADPTFPPPRVSVFTPHHHSWVGIPQSTSRFDGHSANFSAEAEQAMAELRKHRT
jgi:hypothetical protein